MTSLYLGPLCKGIALTYLSYMTIFKGTNVPILFFIAHGTGSFAFLRRLKTIKINDKIVDVEIYEQYFNIVLCILSIFFILLKNKSITLI